MHVCSSLLHRILSSTTFTPNSVSGIPSTVTYFTAVSYPDISAYPLCIYHIYLNTRHSQAITQPSFTQLLLPARLYILTCSSSLFQQRRSPPTPPLSFLIPHNLSTLVCIYNPQPSRRWYTTRCRTVMTFLLKASLPPADNPLLMTVAQVNTPPKQGQAAALPRTKAPMQMF